MTESRLSVRSRKCFVPSSDAWVGDVGTAPSKESTFEADEPVAELDVAAVLELAWAKVSLLEAFLPPRAVFLFLVLFLAMV